MSSTNNTVIHDLGSKRSSLHVAASSADKVVFDLTGDGSYSAMDLTVAKAEEIIVALQASVAEVKDNIAVKEAKRAAAEAAAAAAVQEAVRAADLRYRVGNILHERFCSTVVPGKDLFGKHETIADIIIKELS